MGNEPKCRFCGRSIPEDDDCVVVKTWKTDPESMEWSSYAWVCTMKVEDTYICSKCRPSNGAQ